MFSAINLVWVLGKRGDARQHQKCEKDAQSIKHHDLLGGTPRVYLRFATF